MKGAHNYSDAHILHAEVASYQNQVHCIKDSLLFWFFKWIFSYRLFHFKMNNNYRSSNNNCCHLSLSYDRHFSCSTRRNGASVNFISTSERRCFDLIRSISIEEDFFNSESDRSNSDMLNQLSLKWLNGKICMGRDENALKINLNLE